MPVHVVIITQQLKLWGKSLIVIFASAAREPAHSNKCGSSP